MEGLEQIETISQEQWREIVAGYAEPHEEPKVRRTARRFPVSYGRVKLLFVLECAGVRRPQRWDAALLQLSDHGLMVRTERELPAYIGVAVQVALEDETATALGRVVHCTSTIGGYKVGIELSFD